MPDRRLEHRIERVASRIRSARRLECLAWGWSLLAIGAACCWVLHLTRSWQSPQTVPFLIAATVCVFLLAIWRGRRSARIPRMTAQQIESTFPDLDARLLTALDQSAANGERLHFLQESVIREALRHDTITDWGRTIPHRTLWRRRLSGVTSLAALVVCLFGLQQLAPEAPAEETPQKDVQVLNAGESYDVTVDPGDAEIELGRGLVVQAKFDGPVPADSELVFRLNEPADVVASDEEAADDAIASLQRLPMEKRLDDPVFARRIESVRGPLSYRVEFGSGHSDWYQVTVFEYPKLVQADAEIEYPSYTNLDPRSLQDIRRLTVVEGSHVTLKFRLNKAVETAELDGEGELPAIEFDRDDPRLAIAQLTARESTRFKLKLTDEAGRENRYPAEFVLKVTRNKRPDIKIVRPSRDVEVSPVEELDVAAKVWDDFGLLRYGVSFSLAGQDEQTIVLGESAAARENHETSHLISFESLNASPDQLLTYFFWAEDVGVDGNVRVTQGDLFFAEVRHFEEIFRQGNPSAQGQNQRQQRQQQQGSQGAQQAEELIDLQKQIINASWKLIRRHNEGENAEKLAPDTQLVSESQEAALGQLAEAMQALQDRQSLGFADEVGTHMQQAIDHLTAAIDDGERLTAALGEEQSAYQGLLKLREREHEVVRQNQQQQNGNPSSSRNASSRFQQQLNELELDNERNRYENESQASADQQESQEQREVRQVLNRLRELAQRQADLNKRIRELEAQLEAAEDEKEREELQRQLDRLQEAQQDILRDTDELAQRMEEPENERAMSESRQELEETRENVQKASEALKENELSDAVNAGTRAEREFRDLQEEFRRRSSERFAEEVRDLRNQARELTQKEKEIAEQLEKVKQDDTTSLRPTDDREQLKKDVADQRERLNKLFQDLEETVLEAEETEPLLSRQLYDAVRDGQQGELPDALDATEKLIERGFLDEAQRAESAVQEGLEKLQGDIEKAAESVLGDETEALRRAANMIDNLQRQLNQEIEENDPSQSGREPGEQEPREGQEGQPRDGQPREGQEPNDRREGGRRQEEQEDREPREGQEGQEGQPREGEPQDGQPREGQPREGQPQDGQPQEGQPQEGQPRDGQPQDGQPRDGQRPNEDNQDRQRRGAVDGNRAPNFFDQFTEQLDPAVRFSPLTGENFRDWSDRLRDVEEMIDDPELRAEAARIRERARQVRIELKRHSKEPNWDLVRLGISEPLKALHQKVTEELLKRQSPDALVPIDRDPVPSEFSEQVRKYFERLGSGR